MNKSDIIFTPDNIISAFGIIIEDRFEYEMDQSNCSFLISSKSPIANQNQSEGSCECFVTDIYQDVSNPYIVAFVKTDFNKDGSFTTAVDFNNQDITNLLKVSNRYLEVYKLIYDIKEFDKYDKVDLVFIAEYTFTDSLVISRLHCEKIKLFQYVDDSQGSIETGVHYFVNYFLKSLGIAYIDEHTDMEKLYPLIEMQRTLNHMEKI